jgi:RNA polymerase sigma-70 factor (ECF subfamily)
MTTSPNTEALWTEFHRAMLSFIRRRVSSSHDADDILQEMFVRVHAHLSRDRPVTNLAAWLYRVAQNSIHDHYRQTARSRDGMKRLAEEPSAATDESSSGASAELAGCLEALLERLPPAYREALTLTELGGMSQVAAAPQLGLSVSGVKSRVQRGRRKLKQVLLDCCDVELDARRGVVAYESRTRPRERGCPCRCDC